MNIYNIALLLTPGLDKHRLFNLLKTMPVLTAYSEFIDIVKDSIKDFANLNEKIGTLDTVLKRAEYIHDLSADLNIHLISYFDDDFPTALKSIDNPPLVLNCKGNINSLHTLPGIAIIGTREPSAFGIGAARKLGEIFGEKQFNVISGLALGCDSAAHTGCLNAHGVTTAVLANGLDKVYPSQNKALVERILENKGCIVSEYFVKQTVTSYMFVDRDRIQAGLSRCVAVVESDVKGGSMHTVRYGIKNNRSIVCLKYPFELSKLPTVRGTENLIKTGKAIPLSVYDQSGAFYKEDDIDKLIKTVFKESEHDINKVAAEIKQTKENIDKGLGINKVKGKQKKTSSKKVVKHSPNDPMLIPYE